MLKGPTALPDLKEFITFLNFNRCDWKNRKIIRTSLSQEVQWWLSGSWNLFIDLFSSIDKDIIKPVSHSFWVLYFNIIMYEVRYTRTNLIFQFNNWLNTCPKLFHIRLVCTEIFGIVLNLTFSQFRHHFVSELLVQIFHVLVKSAIKFSQMHITLHHYIFNSVRYPRFGFYS